MGKKAPVRSSWSFRAEKSFEMLVLVSAAFALFVSGTRFYSDGTATFGALAVFLGLFTLNSQRFRIGPRGVIILLWTLLLAWVLVQAQIGSGSSVSARLNPSTRQLERAVQVIATGVLGLASAGFPRTLPPPTLPTPGRLRRTPNIGLLLIPLVVVFVGVGPNELWNRDSYNPELSNDFGQLLVLAGILLLPCVFVLAYVASTSEIVLTRRLNWFACSAYLLLFMGQGSRKFPVAVLAISAVRVVFGKQRRRFVVAVAGIWVGMAALSVSIALRNGNSNGLMHSIPKLISESVSPSAPLDVFESNVGFSFPLTAVVATQQPPTAKKYLSVSLNPLPSGYTSWATDLDKLRVNFFTPFNGLGELGQSGLLVTFLFSFSIGTILNLAVSSTERFGYSLRAPLYLLYLGVAGNIGITMLQYNLRSSARFVYYTLLSLIVFRVLGAAIRPANRSSDPMSTLGALVPAAHLGSQRIPDSDAPHYCELPLL